MRKQSVGAILSSALVGSMLTSVVLATEKTSPPADVSRFVGPKDTLLAFQEGDLFGPGMPGAVLIVRHPVPDKPYDFDQNPCELIVVKGTGPSASQFTRGTTTVDCVYNNLNKTLGALALNDLVAIKPGSFSFTNQKDRGADGFFFRYSAMKAEWYLERAIATFPGEDGIVTEEAIYPRDFKWTSLSDVSPEELAKALQKHKTVGR